MQPIGPRLLVALLLGAAACLPAAAQEPALPGPPEGAAPQGCDYLMVTAPAPGSPPGLVVDVARAVSRLAEHRRAEGMKVTTGVQFGPHVGRQIQDEVRKLRPKYLLLVGGVDAIPAFEIAETASDRPYGDLDGDGYPEVSVGRIPSSDPEVVARVVARTIAYEQERDGGLWRKQCALVAGEGRFSPQIDSMIEGLFNQVVSKAIDPAYDIDLTYANPNSPYCYPPRQLADRVVDRLNQGALIFAYVGHGAERSVDELQVKGPDGKITRYPVLDASHVERLRTGGAPPVVVSIACWTGRMDGERPSIGEELLATDGGPVAFYGSSRISHPVQNALLAMELVRSLFDDTGELRLGPALDRAERAMVLGAEGPADPVRAQVMMMASAFLGADEMRKEMPRHVDMYNLFGDPALRLARPDGRIALRGPEAADAGSTIEVEGAVPNPDAVRSVTVTVEVPRERSARPDPSEGETPYERFARANDKVVITQIVGVEADGRFSLALDLPAGLLSGAYQVKAFAQGRGTCAIGSLALKVAADPGFDPFEEDEAPAPTSAVPYY